MINRSFYLEAEWGSRVEAPECVAQRFLQSIDGLCTIHPLLDGWDWGDYQEIGETEGTGGAYPLAGIRPRMAEAIERNLGSDGESPPDPYSGYYLFTRTQAEPSKSSISFGGAVGARPTGGSGVIPFTNELSLEVGPAPDPTLTTFPFWRAALLLIAETWEATWAHASPDDIDTLWSGKPCDCAWMSTISPRFAPLITPPPNVIVEHRPNGGLFLAATDTTFRTSDPQHAGAARSIAAALEPLNRLPYPIDDPYR